MKWRANEPRYQRFRKWHSWFAWYPVRITTPEGEQWFWMERVARKYEWMTWTYDEVEKIRDEMTAERDGR